MAGRTTQSEGNEHAFHDGCASREAHRTALITGASAGIGAAFARVFAEHGFDLILTARRVERLESLAAELRLRHGISVYVFPADLADPDTPANLNERMSAAGLHVDAIVNNAGYGLTGTFLESPWSEHQRFLQVMLTSVVRMTHLVLPGMIERGYGRIINVSSVAGLLPGTAGHTLYAAVKMFLVRFSQSLALEGEPHGIRATALCPGFTLTEFHDVSGTRPLVSRLPRWMWLDADSVARYGYQAVMKGRVVAVHGPLYRLLYAVARHFPDELMLRMTKHQGTRYRLLRSTPPEPGPDCNQE